MVTACFAARWPTYLGSMVSNISRPIRRPGAYIPVWVSPFISATEEMNIRVRIWRSWVYRPSELATRMLWSASSRLPETWLMDSW